MAERELPGRSNYLVGSDASRWHTDVPTYERLRYDGVDAVLYGAATGAFFLRNSNTPGLADTVFTFGAGGATPLAGNWDGN